MHNIIKANRFFILSILVGLFLFLIFVYSCTEDYFVPIPVPKPKVPVETENLEASFSSAINGINSSYWNQADYLKVELKDLSKENLYLPDGLLNMTGTYSGLGSFNEGEVPEVIMKAAYDSLYIYLLIEWADSDIDAFRRSWLWNGPSDPLKNDSSEGWTSQRNDDMLALAFEAESVSGPSGSFSDVGCASACHNGTMKTAAGVTDIWNWSLALSEPVGFAFDMHAGSDSGLVFDEGQVSYERNINISGNNRSGPAYEWNGSVQEITQFNGKKVILDPAYFLLEKAEFKGNPEKADHLYVDNDKGCSHCHGVDGKGNGEIDNGPAFTHPRMNRFSRENLISSASDLSHTGQTYFNKLNNEEKEDIIAKIRGFTGVPGYYLSKPDSQDIDILAESNLILARLEPENIKYRVMLKRKLKTLKHNDIQFDISSRDSYIFGIAVMDHDGKNHVGSSYETLIFVEE